MRRDYLGNPVGALHDSTLRGIDDFVAGLLGYETRAERILAAADAEPGSCIANAYAGLLWMLLEAPAGARRAAQYLGAADDHHCWGVAKDYSQDQIGAVLLLARLEIAGTDVGPRWQELGHHLAARARDTTLPFLTLQYLYGLARAQRPEADTLLDAVRRHAACAPPFTREVWREIALPGCEGLHAYASGDFGAAWHHLTSSVPRMAQAGGSHAQRDLFAQILLDTAVKSGRSAIAQQWLELRRAADPNGVPLNTALAGVYDELGLPELGRRARERAMLTRARHPD